jgi:protein required for attachment to host cells
MDGWVCQQQSQQPACFGASRCCFSRQRCAYRGQSQPAFSVSMRESHTCMSVDHTCDAGARACTLPAVVELQQYVSLPQPGLRVLCLRCNIAHLRIGTSTSKLLKCSPSHRQNVVEEHRHETKHRAASKLQPAPQHDGGALELEHSLMRRCFDAVLAVAAPRLCGGSRSSHCWHCSLSTFNTAETAKAGLQHQSQDADCQDSKPTTRPVTGNWSLPPPRASPPPPAPHPDDQRRLIVAVVGLPNAGKSTLVNRLAGTKVAGVSSKRNTTISPQLGAFSHGNAQVLLYDTPGLTEAHERSSALDRLRAAWATAAMADQLLLIVDAERMVRPGCLCLRVCH